MEIDVVTGSDESGPDLEVEKNDSKNLIESVFLELNKKNVWRSLTSLAVSLRIDRKELKQKLEKIPNVVSRVGKNDTLYCLYNRLTNKKSKKVEEDYAIAMLHMIFFQFYKTMKTYGLEIGSCDTEAFSYFTSALDKLESGLLIFSKKTNTSMEKLPKFN